MRKAESGNLPSVTTWWDELMAEFGGVSLRELLAIRWLRWVSWGLVFGSVALMTWLGIREAGLPNPDSPVIIVFLFGVIAFTALMLWACMLAFVAFVRAARVLLASREGTRQG